MTTKDDESAGVATVSAEGRGEPGRDFDPQRPECDAGEEPAGRPVTHGTPLAPEEYARLKERAKRRGPEERKPPAQHDR